MLENDVIAQRTSKSAPLLLPPSAAATSVTSPPPVGADVVPPSLAPHGSSSRRFSSTRPCRRPSLPPHGCHRRLAHSTRQREPLLLRAPAPTMPLPPSLRAAVAGTGSRFSFAC
uniref:Uncharacterized protein n=1 Tax=Oryza nivara TaxID=4536 RepID=A0A0E0GGB3_ORYNI